MCKQIIARVELARGCRILSVYCEFVQDPQGRIWLSRATDCKAAFDADAQRRWISDTIRP